MGLTRALGPRARRVLQSLLYELFALAFVAPLLGWLFDKPVWSTLGLTLATSGIALVWNYAFNAVFEAWEARQTDRTRTWGRRLVHGVAFEIGLAALLVPFMAWWLDVSLWMALIADLGLIAFFFFYTMAFTWAFDRVFGLPQSARA